MIRLIDIGFNKVGEWTNENDVFNHTIVNHRNESNLLYAFIVDKVIFYIGKTTDTLKNRMNGYKNANSSQKTNIRVKAKILEQLNQSKSVEIYILIDNANLKFGNYKISLASGLEDNLIAIIEPEWNFRGKIRIKEQVVPAENENMIIENMSQTANIIEKVEIRLGQEYWSKGFFNFSKKTLDLLPNEATQVTILLGENDDYFTLGYFHFATKDKQPRVRGNKGLKEWFQENYKQGDIIKIDILKSDLYRIK